MPQSNIKDLHMKSGFINDRSKLILILTLMLALVFLITGCQGDKSSKDTTPTVPIVKDETPSTLSVQGTLNKEDYIEACDLIAKNYIHLESQLHVTPEKFYNDSKVYADQIEWTGEKNQLVNEIRKLMSKFKDGHISWFLSSDYRISKSMTLGFVATKTTDNHMIISKVYPTVESKLSPNDEILEWNGHPVQNEIHNIALLAPRSTPISSFEYATRRLSTDFSFMPLRETYAPVTLKIKRKNGNEEDITLDWTECSGYTSFGESVDESDGTPSIFLTPSLIPSTEEIPNDASYIHPSLLYYTREVGDEVVAVLHPRDFYRWSQEDLDQTMEALLAQEPTVFLIDLKDTAGGSFDQVLFLSHALDITNHFKYLCNTIHEDTGESVLSHDNFDFIEREIDLKNTWDGKVIFKINPIVQSGGDFFSRWMQLNNKNNRFLFIGTPTGGAGAGTDSYELTHSKIEISIPRRDYQIVGDDAPIEGHSVEPDLLTDMSVETFLKSPEFDLFMGTALKTLMQSDMSTDGEVPSLQIAQGQGEYYDATDTFSKRVMLAMKTAFFFTPRSTFNFKDDVKLKFEGYSTILLDTKQGLFRFENEKNIYSCKALSSQLWQRYVMKIINDKPVYDTFNKDILFRKNLGRQGDEENPELLLFYDGDIRISVDREAFTVMAQPIEEAALESGNFANQYTTEVLIRDSLDQNKKDTRLILVGIEYSFVNKYGSTASLKSYYYENHKFNEDLDINQILSSPLSIVSYENGLLTLSLDDYDQVFTLPLTKDEIHETDAYISFLKSAGKSFIKHEDYVYLSNLRTYKLYDYDQDGEDEVIATVNMRGYTSGIGDTLYFVLKYEGDRLHLDKIIPSRSTQNLEAIFE